MVEFEDLVHGSLQDDPEQIELLQTVLDKWEQVGEELEFEDPDDEKPATGKSVSEVEVRTPLQRKLVPHLCRRNRAAPSNA